MDQASALTASQSDVLPQEENGIPLKVKLRRAERMKKIRAMALIAPLFIFTMLIFAIPIGIMLVRSIDNPEVVSYLPNTKVELDKWSGEGMPPQTLTAILQQIWFGPIMTRRPPRLANV